MLVMGSTSQHMAPSSQSSMPLTPLPWTVQGSPTGTGMGSTGLQVVAFLTPQNVPAAYKELPPGERSVVVVVMNQADVTAPFDFVYGAYAASTTVPAHSIQTYILPHES